MKFFEKLKKQKKQEIRTSTLQTVRYDKHPFSSVYTYAPLSRPEHRLYDELRLAVPIIDAGIHKIIRLLGTYKVVCSDENIQDSLDEFLSTATVSGTGGGLNSFLYTYISDLLTYGNAVGEIVLDESGEEIYGFYNAPLERLYVKRNENGLDIDFYSRCEKNLYKLENPELILYSSLSPRAGEVAGRSLLEGLPFVTNILLKIYHSTEMNFDRVGNVRFLVNYKPSESESGFSKEHMETIGKEWTRAMRSDGVSDFMTMGDVEIKTIGADNQVLDTQVPVRQMLEQIVAKLGIPPYLLGLSWSTTERMSSVQADILTSELKSYQNLVTPVIYRIVRTYLEHSGNFCDFEIVWDNINLQDKTENANARLINAKARVIEMDIEDREEEI